MSTRLNISVPDELAERVRSLGLRVSEICQKALQEAAESAEEEASPLDERDFTVSLGVDPADPAVAAVAVRHKVCGKNFLWLCKGETDFHELLALAEEHLEECSAT